MIEETVIRLDGEKVVRAITGMLLSVVLGLAHQQRWHILIHAATSDSFNVRVVEHLHQAVLRHLSGTETPELDELLADLERFYKEEVAHG
jgi:hypothetical protein